MDAAQALRELTEVSSQIDAALLLGRDGSLLASTLAEDAASDRLARTVVELVLAGEEAPREVGEGALAQLEVALLDGSVFVVCDEERIAAATTTPDPTAGLVFYDLKSCLRAAAAGDGDGRPRPAKRGPAA